MNLKDSTTARSTKLFNPECVFLEVQDIKDELPNRVLADLDLINSANANSSNAMKEHPQEKEGSWRSCKLLDEPLYSHRAG